MGYGELLGGTRRNKRGRVMCHEMRCLDSFLFLVVVVVVVVVVIVITLHPHLILNMFVCL